MEKLLNYIQETNFSKRMIIAIEGGSASGKSTLAGKLEKLPQVTVIHMDDYFLPVEKRTKERLQEIGGNIDYERMEKDVFLNLDSGVVRNNTYDCMKNHLVEREQLVISDVLIIEGVYSYHPRFQKYYDFAVFLEIDEEVQKERILKRNGPRLYKRFVEEWIPMENAYFKEYSIREKCRNFTK